MQNQTVVKKLRKMFDTIDDFRLNQLSKKQYESINEYLEQAMWRLEDAMEKLNQ